MQVGPGSYNPSDTKLKYPKFTFGYKFDRLRHLQEETNMGPGYYDPNYKSLHSTKGLTITKAKRKGPEIENCSPAPNRYF